MHERGIELECAGDLDAAIDSYHLALQAGGADQQIIFDLAYALDRRGDYAAAAERYRQVIEAEPTCVEAWINLAEALFSLGDRNAGWKAMHRAVALAPADPFLRRALATMASL